MATSDKILWKLYFVVLVATVIVIVEVNSAVPSSNVRARRLALRYMNRLGSKAIVNGRRMFWYCRRGAKLAICHRNSHKRRMTVKKSSQYLISKDSNECAKNINLCQHICTNTIGSFRCSCRTGFNLQLDGKSCIEEATSVHEKLTSARKRSKQRKHTKPTAHIDNGFRKPANESSRKRSFLRYPALTRWYQPRTSRQRRCTLRCRYKCVWENGIEKCVCPYGFIVGTDKKSCVDLNECSNSLGSVCPKNQICINTYGGFSCKCHPGYITTHGLFGKTCRDVNECLTGEYLCSRHSQCINTVGSFACSCLPGYSGNGIICKWVTTYSDELDLPFGRSWSREPGIVNLRPELE